MKLSVFAFNSTYFHHAQLLQNKAYAIYWKHPGMGPAKEINK